MLEFTPVSFENKELMDKYTTVYGENSCQHSFVSSYIHRAKYGDMICVLKDFLVVMRDKQCTDSEIKYLFPLGDKNRKAELKACIDELLEDAKERNKKIVFEGITVQSVEALKELYPGEFEYETNRDYYEYIFSAEKLRNLEGGHFRNRRNEISNFMRKYEGRLEIRSIEPSDIAGLKAFQDSWIAGEGDESILLESVETHEALDNYTELGLKGIVILIDGEIKGFNIGSPLSDKVMDGLFIKACPDIHYMYSVLYNSFNKLHCQDYLYMNWEEDLGIAGLRKLKEGYLPEYMIEKHIARQC